MLWMNFTESCNCFFRSLQIFQLPSFPCFANSFRSLFLLLSTAILSCVLGVPPPPLPFFSLVFFFFPSFDLNRPLTKPASVKPFGFLRVPFPLSCPKIFFALPPWFFFFCSPIVPSFSPIPNVQPVSIPPPFQHQPGSFFPLFFPLLLSVTPIFSPPVPPQPTRKNM